MKLSFLNYCKQKIGFSGYLNTGRERTINIFFYWHWLYSIQGCWKCAAGGVYTYCIIVYLPESQSTSVFCWSKNSALQPPHGLIRHLAVGLDGQEFWTHKSTLQHIGAVPLGQTESNNDSICSFLKLMNNEIKYISIIFWRFGGHVIQPIRPR